MNLSPNANKNKIAIKISKGRDKVIAKYKMHD